MPNFNSTVLITGAAGFIGSHLCKHYLEEGFRVIGVDNLATGRLENIHWLQSLPQARSRFLCFESDVCEPWEFLDSVPSEWLKSLKYILHFASPASPPLYVQLALETLWVNSIGLNHALKTADQFKARVVFASTSEIYGDPEISPQPEKYRGNVNTVGPRSCYDEAKRFGESLLYTHNLKHHTQHGIVRIFNTYGPRMNPTDGRVVINFLIQGLNGQALTVYGDGKQTRSFCFVSDLVRAITLYASSNETQPINIGNDKEFSILQLAEKVSLLFSGKKLPIEFKSLPVDDPLQRRPDLTLAKEKLNYEPSVSLEEGLRIMKDHLKEELKL